MTAKTLPGTFWGGLGAPETEVRRQGLGVPFPTHQLLDVRPPTPSLEKALRDGYNRSYRWLTAATAGRVHQAPEGMCYLVEGELSRKLI